MPEKPIVTVFTPVPRFHYRVGIYCRVSTKSQEQLDSLANQVSNLTRLVAAKLDWSLADIYLDIRSGADVARRNEFQRLLADCRDHKLDVVFTKSISRFGRNTVETLAAINELRTCRVEVVFDQDDISTKDPSSQVMISILEGVAQAESEAKGKNIRWGILRKVENGTSSLFTRKCYGYCIDEEGNLQIDDEEASVVRLVFDLYQHGKSVLNILRELESRGIKSPTGNEKWCKRSIDVMLSNEKYSGDVVVFKTFTAGFPNRRRTSNEGQRERYISVSDHPAIISKEVFAAVQAEKARRSNIEKTEGGKVRKKTRFSSKQKIE